MADEEVADATDVEGEGAARAEEEATGREAAAAAIAAETQRIDDQAQQLEAEAAEELPPTEEGEGAETPEAKPGEAMTDELVDLAMRLGLKAEQIEDLGDKAPVALKHLQEQERQYTEYVGSLRAQPQPRPTPQTPVPQQQASPAGDAMFRPSDGGQAPLQGALKDLADAVGGEEIVRYGFEPVARQLLQQQQQIAALQARIQAQDGERIAREVDGFIDNLGEEGQKVYGKGPIGKMKPQSAEVRARQQLYANAVSWQRARAQQGYTVPLRDALEQASMLQTREEVAQGEREKIRQALTKRKSAMLPRPSSRQRSGETPEVGNKAAVREVAAMIREADQGKV